MGDFPVLVAGIAGLDILVLFLVQRHSAAALALAKSESELSLAEGHLRALEAEVSERAGRQQQVEAAHSRAREQFRREEDLTRSRQQAELDRVNSHYLGGKRRISAQRQELERQQREKIATLNRDIGATNAGLRQELGALSAQEKSEVDSATVALLNGHLASTLKRVRLQEADVPGVNTGLKERLIACNFVTAADIGPSVEQVRGIGPAKAAALMSWRRKIEQRARASAPSLPVWELQAIRDRFVLKRHELEAKLVQVRDSAPFRLEAIRQVTQKAMDALGAEESGAALWLEKSEQQIRATFSPQLVKLDRERRAALAQAEAAVRVSASEVRESRSKLFDAIQREQRLRAEVDALQAARFSRYLRRVFLGR